MRFCFECDGFGDIGGTTCERCEGSGAEPEGLLFHHTENGVRYEVHAGGISRDLDNKGRTVVSISVRRFGPDALAPQLVHWRSDGMWLGDRKDVLGQLPDALVAQLERLVDDVKGAA